jgi:hypothetical protein
MKDGLWSGVYKLTIVLSSTYFRTYCIFCNICEFEAGANCWSQLSELGAKPGCGISPARPVILHVRKVQYEVSARELPLQTQVAVPSPGPRPPNSKAIATSIYKYSNPHYAKFHRKPRRTSRGRTLTFQSTINCRYSQTSEP